MPCRPPSLHCSAPPTRSLVPGHATRSRGWQPFTVPGGYSGAAARFELFCPRYFCVGKSDAFRSLSFCASSTSEADGGS